ncbi:hypothetical protein L195_g042836, partial [Trifolium pratense]
LQLLLDLLDSSDLGEELDGAAALYTLANRASRLYQVDSAPSVPITQDKFGTKFSDDGIESDIEILVEG